MISARNGAMNREDRETIAGQLMQYRIELLDIANQQTQDGNYIFGGSGSERAPFWPQNSPTYQSEPGVRQTGLRIPYDLTVDGSWVMQGFGARGEESIFQELDTVINALRGSGDMDGALKRGMSSVDQTLNLMSEQRSILGEQMHMIDARERLLSSGELSASQRRSDLMDTDYAEVLSGIQSRDMALRAAMQTYSQVSRLSMFDYL